MICEVTDDEAVCTSDNVASEPESRVALVKRRVAAPQTPVAVSATKVPNDVSDLEPYDQMILGSEVIMLPIDVEAVLSVPLITEAIDDDAVLSVRERVEICESVFPLTTAAIEDDAVLIDVARAEMSDQTIVSVLVLIPVTSDHEIVSVLVLIPVTSAQAIVSVLALI